MPIDASLYSQFAPPVRSVTDIENALNQGDLQRSQIQQNQLAVAQARNVAQQRAQLTSAVQSGQIDLSNPQHAAAALTMAPDVAPAMLKTIQEGQQSGAKAKLDLSQAGHADAETDSVKLTQAATKTAQLAQGLATVNAPEDAVNWYEQGVHSGLITKDQAVDSINKMPTDPQGFAQWKQQQQTQGLSLAQQFEQQAKQAEEAGRNSRTAAEIKGRASNVATTQAGENSRAALSRSTQLQINGMDANGNYVGLGAPPPPGPAQMVPRPGVQPVGPPTAAGVAPAAVGPQAAAPQAPASPITALVDALGQGKIDPATAFARVPAGMKSAILAQVAQKYPGYDPTDFAAKKSGEVQFATGKAGNTVRSFNVGLAHLDTLGSLADALNNGDAQIINKIGNVVSQQTGSPNVTNFDAAKKVVGDEIVNAIVGAGGGVADREEASKSLANANSPAQLKGVIDTFKQLMVGQLGGLEGQYKAATGKDDFQTKYLSPNARQVYAGHGSAAAAHPPDITDLLNKYGTK